MTDNEVITRIDSSTDERWASTWIARCKDLLTFDLACYRGMSGRGAFLADAIIGNLPWTALRQTHVCALILESKKLPALFAAFDVAYGAGSSVMLRGELTIGPDVGTVLPKTGNEWLADREQVNAWVGPKQDTVHQEEYQEDDNGLESIPSFLLHLPESPVTDEQDDEPECHTKLVADGDPTRCPTCKGYGCVAGCVDGLVPCSECNGDGVAAPRQDYVAVIRPNDGGPDYQQTITDWKYSNACWQAGRLAEEENGKLISLEEVVPAYNLPDWDILAEQARKDGGFTVSLSGKLQPTYGYTFSERPDLCKQLDPKDLDAGHLRLFASDNLDPLSEANNYFGAYLNPSTGKYDLDVSTNLPDLNEALARATAAQQYSIWDVSGSREILTGNVKEA